MASIEERVAAIRARKEAAGAERVGPSTEDRVEAIRARRDAGAPQQSVFDAPGAKAPMDPNSVSSSLGRGIDSLQANLGSTVEAIGEASGSEYLAEVGKGYREEQLQEASQYGNPEYDSYRDVDWESPEQIASFLKERGLSSAPSLGLVGAGAATGALAGSVVPVIGTGVGAGIGALLAGIGVNIGDVQSQIKAIDPDAKSPWASILAGTGMGALDAVGLKAIARPFIKEFGEEVTFQVLKRSGVIPSMAANATKGAAAEAATEATQSVAGNLTAAAATNTDVNVDSVIENAINSAFAGGITGGVASGAASVPATISRNARVAGTAAPARDFTEGQKTHLNLAQQAINIGGGSSLDPLMPWARVSPTMREFVRKFRPDETGETATGATLGEQQALMAGQWATALEEAMDAYGANVPIPRVRSRRRNEFFRDLADPTQASPAKLPIIQQARSVLDGVLGEAKAAGLDVGTVQNYLPLSLSRKLIEKNRESFVDSITPYYQDRDAAELAVDNWIAQDNRGPNDAPPVERLVQDNGAGGWAIMPSARKSGDPETMRYRFAQGTTAPEFGQLEKNRAFSNVPQSILAKFAKEQSGTAKYNAVRDYMEGAAHRVAYAREMGGKDEKANAMIARAVQEAEQAGFTPQKGEIDQAYGILDAYNGTYNRWKNQSVKTIQSTVGAILTIKALPLSVLSSMVEIATPAIRGDIAAALATLAPSFGEVAREASRTLLKGLPRSEFARTAAEANLSFSASQNIASERLGANMFSRGAAKATRMFFLANGLSYWTHFLTTYAAKTGEYIIQRNLNALSSGLDITSAKGAQYANQLRSMGYEVSTNDQAMAYWNPRNPSEIQRAKNAKVLGIRRFTRQAVLEPGIADTPLWMHDGRMGLIAMLHRYPAAFTNTILPALFRKGRPSWAGSGSLAGVGATGALFILGAIIAIGYMQDEMKQIAKNGEFNYDDTRDEAQRFMDILGGTVMPLQMSYIHSWFAAPRYGQSSIGAIAGPAVGFVDETAKTIHSFAEDPQEGKIWQYLYKQTPAQVFRPGREAAKELDVF